MITFSETNDAVTLEMGQADYVTLLMILGFALGSVTEKDGRAWILTFLNELNRTNPRFPPYPV